jgi:hypothetical protein
MGQGLRFVTALLFISVGVCDLIMFAIFFMMGNESGVYRATAMALLYAFILHHWYLPELKQVWVNLKEKRKTRRRK